MCQCMSSTGLFFNDLLTLDLIIRQLYSSFTQAVTSLHSCNYIVIIHEMNKHLTPYSSRAGLFLSPVIWQIETSNCFQWLTEGSLVLFEPLMSFCRYLMLSQFALNKTFLNT